MELEKYRRLVKDRLEWGKDATFVPNKRLPLYNWLYFKEGFSRELVFNLLEKFQVQKGQWVLDPYCGSGTTLLACREKGVNAIGVDRLPVAFLASRVKTQDYNTEGLKREAKNIFGKEFEKIPSSSPFKKFFNPHVLEDVVFFRREIGKIGDEKIKEFFLLGLVSCAIKESYLWKDGNVLKVRKHPVAPFRKFFRKRISRMIKEGERFEGNGKALVKLSDPEKMDVWDGTIDAVVTSPPYLGQINYSKMYAVENWVLGEEAAIEPYIGNEQKYFEDMERVLKELFRACKAGALAGIVIGNAYFPQEDRIVESDLILCSIADKIGFNPKEILVLNRRFALQRRTIRRGDLRESVVVLEK